MIQKKHIVVGAVVVYAFLLTLFFTLKDKQNFNNVCHFASPCVRFCCFDPQTCSSDFINKNFNTSMIPGLTSSDGAPADVKFMFGSPTCRIHPQSSWKFTWVSHRALAVLIRAVAYQSFSFIAWKSGVDGSGGLFQRRERQILLSRLE